MHRVLQQGKGTQGWQALILVPTRELCEQVSTAIFLIPCSAEAHILSKLGASLLHALILDAAAWA